MISHAWPLVVGVVLAAPALAQAHADDAKAPVAAQEAVAANAAPYRFEPGANVPALLIPRHEELVYRAYLDFLMGETNIGKVVQTCAVERIEAPLVAVAPVTLGERARITLQGDVEYAWKEYSSKLETTLFPDPWPRLQYYTESTDDVTRRREVWIGIVEGRPRSRYRGDTKKGAPEGQRIWRDPRDRDVPAGALDMLSAIFMTRELMQGEAKEISFPLVDKDRVWKVTLKRGEERRMVMPAGTFDVVEAVLVPEPWPDEAIDPEKVDQFEGVFGIKGTIHLWVEKRTGIPVRIQGTIPLKFGFEPEVDVQLESFSGTPEAFQPIQVDGAKKK